MMSLQEIAMRQALEALESNFIVGCTAWRTQRDQAITSLRRVLDDQSTESVMIDMSPPATLRDRWMYEQGRLAERDPRTHSATTSTQQPTHKERIIRTWCDHNASLSTKQYMLEMAAKAEGHGVEFTLDGAGDWHCWYENRFTCIPWNPLYYKADAMELAINLELEIMHGTNILGERAIKVGHADKFDGVFEVPHGDDPCAAACLAIVCAAVEIGGTMK